MTGILSVEKLISTKGSIIDEDMIISLGKDAHVETELHWISKRMAIRCCITYRKLPRLEGKIVL